MGKSAAHMLFTGVLLFQLWLVLYKIIPLAPPPNAWGFIDASFYTVIYVTAGIAGMVLKRYKRITYARPVILCSLIVLSFTLSALTEHSAYYHNQGQPGFCINTDNRNPILFYNDLYRFPPRIGVVYILIAYNIIAPAGLLLLAKTKRKK